MTYEIVNHGQCNYEVYDRVSNSVKDCSCDSVIRAGKKYFCSEHAAFAMMMHKKDDTLIGPWHKSFSPTVEQFLKEASRND